MATCGRYDLLVPRHSRRDRASRDTPDRIARTMTAMNRHPPSSARPASAADEWDARVQLAAAYRIFDHLGWTELIYNHISLRVPGEHGALPDQPVRPALLARCCASNLVKVDLAGQHRRPRRLADQPGRHHLPRRDPRDPARRALRDAPAHDGDAGGLLPEGRPGLHQLLRRAALRQGRVPRLRRHHRPRRRRRAHPAERRGPAGAAAAQPRAGDDRRDAAAGAAR